MLSLVKPKVSVLHSRTAGNRIRISVIRDHRIVMRYKYENIKLFRSAYTNIIATLMRAGYDVTYNTTVI